MSLDIQPLLEIAEGLHYLSNPSAQKASALYPYVIDYLMAFDHEAVREMGNVLWELVSKSAVLVSTSPRENLTFIVNSYEGLYQEAAILLPDEWVSLFRDDPIFHIGGVMYTGSQAIDFYNGKLIGQKETATLRGQGYESELLYQTHLEIPDYQFQPYQEMVLTKFPMGLSSLGADQLLYRSAPVTVVEA